MVGRNDPCPCGSGKKYKKCCLSINKNAETVIDKWEKESKEILANTNFTTDEKNKIIKSYFSLMRFIEKENWEGSCHASSSVLYVLFKEYGLDAKLVIGEVKSKELSQPYDHSWVELDGMVFDVAIFKPLNGHKAHKPVFYSKNVENKQNTDAEYGIEYCGLGNIALQVKNRNFIEYMDDFPLKDGLWSIVDSISTSIQYPIYVNSIKQKYDDVQRIHH